ncbi:hypothetical protein BaRGS_00005827, partial [Batillaria attramentaria]
MQRQVSLQTHIWILTDVPAGPTGCPVCTEDSIRSFLGEHDIILLVETFASGFPDHLFPLFDSYNVPGIKLSDTTSGRLSGGVTFLVRKSLSSSVEQVPVEYDNIIVLKVSREVTVTPTDVLVVGVYLPPAGSDYYKDTEIDNGLLILELCVIDLLEKFGDLPFVICGDLIARTGCETGSASVLPDGIFSTDDDDNASGWKDDMTRHSKDVNVNAFGRYLLNLCEQFELFIANGFLPGDEAGDFTYISNSGCSTIDYFVISRTLFSYSKSLKVLPRVESKHVPVRLQWIGPVGTGAVRV